MGDRDTSPPTLGTVAREWGRIGVVGFGGPPAHIALLRELVVERRRWLRRRQFEDGLAAVNLLPGPASTQLAIFTAWRTRGVAGALVGGTSFVLPGLVLIVVLAALFLGSPPDWIRGAGAGAGAAVAAVAIHAGVTLLAPAWQRVGEGTRRRFVVYALLGGAAAATLGPWLVLVLLACGLAEIGWRRLSRTSLAITPFPLLAAAVDGRNAGLARMGRVQGRSPVVRRRLRDHPAHAGGRGRTLRLDDRHRVPQRRRAGSGDPRPGRPHRGGGRLRGGRRPGRASRRARRFRTVVRLRARRRAALRPLRREHRRSALLRRSRPCRDRGDPRIRHPARARSRRSAGRPSCSRAPRCRSSSCAEASSSPCSQRAPWVLSPCSSERRLPVATSPRVPRRALEGADDVGRDPAAVEVAFLCDDELVVDVAGVHPARVEGHRVTDRLEARTRLADTSRRRATARVPPATTSKYEALPLPLAERLATAGRLEGTGRDVLERDVVHGRVARLEHTVRASRVHDRLAAEHDADAARGRLDTRRTRVVPDGLGHSRMLPGRATRLSVRSRAPA